MEKEQHLETVSYISRVPNEVLGLIFKELKDLHLSSEHSWCDVLLVSRHWKTVALADGSLWANLPTYDHTGTLCMLKRSRTSPLEARIDHRTAESTVSVVFDNINRLGRLSIGNGAWHAHNFQARLLEGGHKASQLKVLGIDFVGSGNNPPPPAPLDRAVTLPHLVSLQELYLWHGIEYDWNMFSIPGLRILSLSEVTPLNPPSWTQFLDALREMPFLEDIDINFTELTLTSTGPPEAAMVDMRQLRRISIRGGSLSALGYFFSRTSLPALQNADLVSDYDGENEYPDYFATTIRGVLGLLSGGQFSPLDCLTMSADGFDIRTTNAWLRDALRFQCQDNLPDELRRDMVNQLGTQLARRAVDILRLTIAMDVNSQDLRKIFRNFPHLKSLEVLCGYDSVLQCLSAPQSVPENEQALPLVIEELSVGSWYTLRDEKSLDALASQLLDCLTSRQQSGFVLHKLTLTGKFTEDHADIFEGIVDEVSHHQHRQPAYYDDDLSLAENYSDGSDADSEDSGDEDVESGEEDEGEEDEEEDGHNGEQGEEPLDVGDEEAENEQSNGVNESSVEEDGAANVGMTDLPED